MAIQDAVLNQLFNVIGGGQGGTVLGNGYTDKIRYIQPFIDNPEYDKNNPYGIDKETERVVNTPDGPIVIGRDAPRGFGSFSNVKKAIDAISGNRWDLDKMGPGKDAWGELPETGYGRRAVKVSPHMENPQYPGNPNLPGAGPVPQISRKGQAEQILQQEYQTRRANANTLYMYDQLFPRIADAQYYGYELDKAQMYDYLNTQRGQAETDVIAAQSRALPRLAKAELIKAIADRQKAANEFGELGIKRTYTPGISTGSIA